MMCLLILWESQLYCYIARLFGNSSVDNQGISKGKLTLNFPSIFYSLVFPLVFLSN